MQQFLEALTVFSRIDHVGTGADDGHARGLQPQSQFEGGLATILDDDARGLFLVDDFQHILQREGLEIQSI